MKRKLLFLAISLVLPMSVFAEDKNCPKLRSNRSEYLRQVSELTELQNRDLNEERIDSIQRDIFLTEEEMIYLQCDGWTRQAGRDLSSENEDLSYDFDPKAQGGRTRVGKAIKSYQYHRGKLIEQQKNIYKYEFYLRYSDLSPSVSRELRKRIKNLNLEVSDLNKNLHYRKRMLRQELDSYGELESTTRQ